jgi:Na+-translocating ferredoxin:NAD+ oxidoreductase RNF subunit RnfB
MVLLSSLLIHWSAHRFLEKSRDKYINELKQLLPGKDCGKCGCESCEAYARAIFTLYKDTDCCTEGNMELPRELSACMERFQKSMGQEEGRDVPDYHR